MLWHTDTDTDKDKDKVLPRPNICYSYQNHGVQGFKISYWLSSCDDKDKDKVNIYNVDMIFMIIITMTINI